MKWTQVPNIEVLLFNVIFPLTFNDDINVVILFNVEYPLTFKVPNIEVLLFNVVKPLTFKDDINVALFNNVVNPLTFKADNNVEFPDTVKLPILNIVRVVKSFMYPNILVVVLFKLFSLLVILELIPETSTGAGGLPLPPPVRKSFKLLKTKK